MPLPLNRCQACGYDLAGLVNKGIVICPECGGSIEPHARTAARSMPGSGVTLIVEAVLTLLVLLLGLSRAIALIPKYGLGVYPLVLLALIPITGIVSFKRARHYKRPALDAVEEWIMSMIVALGVMLVSIPLQALLQH
ncbi:MAG: hypothetical protein IPM33_06575 [Phycisphaerales bacterium]|nr:hypothetical protein [Phycisphaerales bacterium]